MVVETKMLEMAKIDSSKITFVENLAFFQGEIFSGIALEICGNTLKSEKKYINGIFQSNYVDRNFPVNDKRTEDWTTLDSLDVSGFEPPYFYEKNGTPYSGFVFDLEKGIFTNETYCKNGYELMSFDYMLNRKINQISIIDDHKKVIIKWDWYGELSKCEIIINEDNSALDIFFEKNLKIRYIEVMNCFFDAIKKKPPFFFCNEEISFILGFGDTELRGLKSIFKKFNLSEELMIIASRYRFNQHEIIEIKDAITKNNVKKIKSSPYIIESLEEYLEESFVNFKKIF